MTTTTDLAPIAVSRTVVRGMLIGVLCGLVGGPLVVVVGAVAATFSSGMTGLFFAIYGLIPAAIVGGIVGAAVGFVGSALAVVAFLVAGRLRGRSGRTSRVAASVGVALGSGGAVAVAAILYSPLGNAGWIAAVVLAPITGAVAAGISWRHIDRLAAYRVATLRERWSWRVLLAGFSLAIVALVTSIALVVDPYWWGWNSFTDSAQPIAGLVGLLVVAPAAAVLLVVGACISVHKTSLSFAAALVTVAILVLVTLIGVASLTPRAGREEGAYPPSVPVEPGGPVENELPAPDASVEPVLPDVATTLFTAAEVTAASQDQIDATIEAVGPIDDPAIPAGTTTFPASIGGCGNVEGGRVNFEVWFLVDDPEGGFVRARDRWLGQGFVLDAASTDDTVVVTGGFGAAIDRMTLENKNGTVKFTVQSVCVAGDDY